MIFKLSTVVMVASYSLEIFRSRLIRDLLEF